MLTDGERKPTHGGGGLRAERRDAATLGVRVEIVRRRRVEKLVEAQLVEGSIHKRREVHGVEVGPAPRVRGIARERKLARRARCVGEARKCPPRGVSGRALDAAPVPIGNLNLARGLVSLRRPVRGVRLRNAARPRRAFAEERLHATEEHPDGAVVREHRRHARAHAAFLNLGRGVRQVLRRREKAQRGHERAALEGLLRGNESKQRAAPTVWVVAGQHAERDGAGEELEEQRESVRAVQREAPRVEPLANLL